MSSEALLVEHRAGVALLTLNRPEVHNAVDEALRGRLAAAMNDIASDPAIGVVLLTAAGTRAFCAGMDLKEFASNSASATAMRRQRQLRAQPFANFPKPVIAAATADSREGPLAFAQKRPPRWQGE